MTVKNHSLPLRYHQDHQSAYTDTRFPGAVFVHAAVSRDRDFATGLDLKLVSENPDWKYKIANKLDAGSGYTRKGGTMQPGHLSCHTQRTTFPTSPSKYVMFSQTTFSGCPDTPTVFVRADDETLADQALTRLKRKVSNAQGDFNALVPLVELKELRGLISQTADLTSTLVKNLIDIKRTGGRSAVRYASKAWLTYGFGVAPMVSDTKAAAKSVSDYLLRSDHSAVLRGKASSKSVSSHNGVASGDALATIDYATNIVHDLSYEYTAGINFNMSSANDYGALDHFHLNLRSLPSVGWELIPFSWVVDYFTTAGAFLDDVFSGDAATTVYVSRARKYKANAQFTLTWDPAESTEQEIVIFRGRNGSGAWEYYEFERTTLPTIPTRSLRFKTADEIGLGSINKLLNLTSILGTNIKRNPPRYTE